MMQIDNQQNSQRSREEIEAHLVTRAWKDESFKQELLDNPKAVIAQEFGVELPEGLNLQVMAEDANTLYITLPARPDLSETELSDSELEAVAGGFTPWTIAIATGTFAGGGLTLGAAVGVGINDGW